MALCDLYQYHPSPSTYWIHIDCNSWMLATAVWTRGVKFLLASKSQSVCSDKALEKCSNNLSNIVAWWGYKTEWQCHWFSHVAHDWQTHRHTTCQHFSQPLRRQRIKSAWTGTHGTAWRSGCQCGNLYTAWPPTPCQVHSIQQNKSWTLQPATCYQCTQEHNFMTWVSVFGIEASHSIFSAWKLAAQVKHGGRAQHSHCRHYQPNCA